MRKKKSSVIGIVQPYSLESKAEYLSRFEANRDMRELFPDTIYRFKLANETFRAKWLEAQVTVTKLDGTQFFIE